jgi:chemotaxis protein CheD
LPDGKKGSAMRKHFLYPGTLFVSSGLINISTILGSCVAVCLWDQVSKIGGINHYVLPYWNGEGLPTPRYGNVAITRLCEQMQRQGSYRRNLVAKVFGGAQISKEAGGLFLVGDRNVQVAWEVLEELSIPVVGHDVGGIKGRKVVFEISSGKVHIAMPSGRVDPPTTTLGTRS